METLQLARHLAEPGLCRLPPRRRLWVQASAHTQWTEISRRNPAGPSDHRNLRRDWSLSGRGKGRIRSNADGSPDIMGERLRTQPGGDLGLSRKLRPRRPCRRLLCRDCLVLRPGRRRSRQQAYDRRGRLLMENRLRVLRAERVWSQQDLAERLEVSRQSVNAIETGKYDPSLPLAFRVAELFDLPIEEIFVSPSRRSSKAI